MGLPILIDALTAAALFALWYFCMTRYNRRKGALALRWVEAACSGKGRVVETQWRGTCRLQAQLGFAAHWFENARVTVRLLPRPIPLQWLLSLWRKQEETLTFEADLDCAPTFQLQIFRHRWLTHRHGRLASGSKTWSISRPGPVVLTTRTQWTQELTPVVNTLMTSRGHSLITVRFRPESPHLAATVALESLSDKEAAAGFLTVVRELATGASTSRQ
ncbi:MAG: hypothetical protein LAN83_13355 [Acidobacteriia bacterium]|nr:hypothetical protein [Terriglobia bacterium]